MTGGAAHDAGRLRGPTTVGELLRSCPPGRITGWDPRNPPEVEHAFRIGYRIGASRCAHISLDAVAELEKRLHARRGDLYCGEMCLGVERWSDRRAALLRGATQGAIEMARARVQGVERGLPGWLDELETWADERPISLDWSSAKPPDLPEPDGRPLRRDEVPGHLWSAVFGMWALMTPDRAEQRPHPSPAAQPRATPPWSQTVAMRDRAPVMVRLSDVQPETVRWLWPGRIAMGKLTLLCGDPGLGKSFVTLDLAARVSSGAPWPDLPLLPNSTGGVVLLSAEDDLADTIRPRLDAAEADVSRIAAIQGVRRVLPTGQSQESDFDLTEDLAALEEAITRTPDCRLVVIDPLTAYLGKTDSHKNAEVRAVLARLFELAARRRVALLAVTHLNKANTLPAIYRAMGSLAFVAAARAVWAAVRDEQDETGQRRLFVPIKNNLGADDSGLAYALGPAGDTARVMWEPEPVDMRADDAMNGGRKPVVREDAGQFVLDTLTANGGDMLSADLTEAAKADGISERTLWRARKAVAESYKEKGRGGRWRCKLKGREEDGQDTHCAD